MDIGLVGLPNAGKSTLFNALTVAGAQTAPYAFCTVEPNIGVVTVPDRRLEDLVQIENSKKITPTSVQFVDIAGLVPGASKGEGLGNKFLGAIREVDAVMHVVRCFSNSSVPHTQGSTDPKRDAELIETELILADLQSVESALTKTRKAAKGGDKELALKVDCLQVRYDMLSEGKPLRNLVPSKEEQQIMAGFRLLTEKPTLFVANIGEDGAGPEAEALEEWAKSQDTLCVRLSGRLEADLAELPEEEKISFRNEMPAPGDGVGGLIQASFRLLDLIVFYTAGEVEARAWNLEKGSTAAQAGGKIHSDFEEKFIKAEVVGFEQLKQTGSIAKCRDLGQVRMEGRDYVVDDGDVMHFRFGS